MAGCRVAQEEAGSDIGESSSESTPEWQGLAGQHLTSHSFPDDAEHRLNFKGRTSVSKEEKWT